MRTTCVLCGAPSTIEWGNFAVCCEAHYTHLDQHMGKAPGLAHTAWCNWCATRARLAAKSVPTQTTLFLSRK